MYNKVYITINLYLSTIRNYFEVIVVLILFSMATVTFAVARNPQLHSCEFVAYVRQGLGATQTGVCESMK